MRKTNLPPSFLSKFDNLDKEIDDFPEIPSSSPTDGFKETWQEEFIKTFAFIGLVLFVFGVLFLIVRACPC